MQWKAVVLTILIGLSCGVTRGEEKAEKTKPGPVEEKVHEIATKQTFTDGTIKLLIKGRGSHNPVTLLPSPEPTYPEPKPTGADRGRGYLTFTPPGRVGVLPAYRPAAGEIADRVRISACPGEYELATFCLRPLQDLGRVKFAVEAFKNPKGEKDNSAQFDLYVLRPTIEQIGYSGGTCRWQAKWLQTADTGTAAAGRNLQVVVDVHVPDNAQAGTHQTYVTVKPEKGKESRVLMEVEVLPLKLSRGLSWGFYFYGWNQPDKNADWILWQLKEMRRTGMTQCVISPIHYQNRPGVGKDGSVDFTIYDQAVAIYRKSGLEDPPIIAMEGLLFGACAALGRAGELNFKDRILGVKAEKVPDDVREFVRRVIRRVYDHSLAVKWPPFYIYFADEPSLGSPKMEQAKFMYKLAREVAPEMRTAGTVYTHAWWEPLEGLLDLNVAHYVHPCNNADGNRRWRALADKQHAELFGIDFIGGMDTFWEGRQMTLTAEKGQLAGMRCWTQGVAWNVADDIEVHPYHFLPNSWEGGPWVMRQKNGRVWRTMAWLGLREGIDDSKYLRTARLWIEKARQSFHPKGRAVADAGERRVEAIMARVPWVPGVRAAGSKWTSRDADDVRRELARVALDVQQALK